MFYECQESVRKVSGKGQLFVTKFSYKRNLWHKQCVCNYHAQCARIESVRGYEPS